MGVTKMGSRQDDGGYHRSVSTDLEYHQKLTYHGYEDEVVVSLDGRSKKDFVSCIHKKD